MDGVLSTVSMLRLQEELEVGFWEVLFLKSRSCCLVLTPIPCVVLGTLIFLIIEPLFEAMEPI